MSPLSFEKRAQPSTSSLYYGKKGEWKLGHLHKKYFHVVLWIVCSVVITEKNLKMSKAAICRCTFETLFLKEGKSLGKTCEKCSFIVKLNAVSVQL